MSDNELLRSVLGLSYLELTVSSLFMDDDLYGGCEVKVNVNEGRHSSSSVCLLLEGGGVGMVDAIFNALKSHYVGEYQSLRSIELQEFKISLSNKTARSCLSKVPGTDNYCDLELTLRNSYDRYFTFTHSSHSLAAAAARGICQGVEHFINAERAYIALHGALSDAQDRGRQDLVTRYTKEMAEVVKCTSYTELIDKLQKDLQE